MKKLDFQQNLECEISLKLLSRLHTHTHKHIHHHTDILYPEVREYNLLRSLILMMKL